MKALSIKSPWWEKILSGKKTIETRTWTTKHRGDLLICATRPTSQAIAIVKLIDCRPMRPEDWQAACCPEYPNAYAWIINSIRPIKRFKVRGKLNLFEQEIFE